MKRIPRLDKEDIMVNKDEKLEELCLAVSDYLFNSKDKYNPYVKIIITNSYIELVESVQGVPIKRYE
jgi:hypothetical protein